MRFKPIKKVFQKTMIVKKGLLKRQSGKGDLPCGAIELRLREMEQLIRQHVMVRVYLCKARA